MVGHGQHEREPGGRLDAAHQRPLAVEREREAAGDRRGDVVGVTLDGRCERDQLARSVRPALQRQRRCQPGDDRGARRSRARLQRHLVAHVEGQAVERPVPDLR